MEQHDENKNANDLFTEDQISYLKQHFNIADAAPSPVGRHASVPSKYTAHTVIDCVDRGECATELEERERQLSENPALHFVSDVVSEGTPLSTQVEHSNTASQDRDEVVTLEEVDTSKLFDLHQWFKHTSVVSLDKFPKRWEIFQERATKAGLTGYKKFHAIEGDKVPPSGWFRGGNGAWGCLMSHLRIVQDALMDDKPGHILVFEDDAVFSDDWLERMHRIMDEVGDDWDMLYLGGQHLHMPRVKPYRMTFNKEVVNARNINRTHAFAINKRFLGKYQQHIMFAPDYIEAKSNFHIDHQLGILHQHQNYSILAAQPWINGQGAGLSWTCGRKTGENWWKIKEEQIAQR